jgi:hypothetical protein
MIWPACAVIAASAVAVAAAAQGPAVRDVRGWMTRVGERVEEYYARAQSIMCEETVRIEPLGPDLLSNGDHVRELIYELRVAWDAATTAGIDGKPPEATVLRQLLTVDGRPPRPGVFRLHRAVSEEHEQDGKAPQDVQLHHAGTIPSDGNPLPQRHGGCTAFRSDAYGRILSNR